MKFRVITIMLIAVMILPIFTGCNPFMVEERLDDVEDAIDNRLDTIEDAVENRTSATSLTKEEAEAIALEHAGFTADQVKYLYSEYEIDNGIPQYEIDFHQDRWEYDYTIHAETGAILSFDKDD